MATLLASVSFSATVRHSKNRLTSMQDVPANLRHSSVTATLEHYIAVESLDVLLKSKTGLESASSN